jgi:hypothetical protein
MGNHRLDIHTLVSKPGEDPTKIFGVIPGVVAPTSGRPIALPMAPPIQAVRPHLPTERFYNAVKTATVVEVAVKK